MADCYLFEGWSWKLPLPEPFNKLPTAKYPNLSKYSKNAAMSTLHGPSLKAMMLYARLREGLTPGNPLGDRIALGTKDTGRFTVAELLPSENSTHCRLIVHDTTAPGNVYGAKVDIKTDAQDAYLLGPEAGKNAGLRDDGTALLFALMPEFLQDEEFKTVFESWTTVWLSGETVDHYNLHACVACDNIYRRLTDESCPAYIPNKIEPSLAKLTAIAVSGGIYSPDTILLGEFNYLLPPNGTAAAGGSAVVQPDAFAGKYVCDPQRVLTDEEKALVPELQPWYVIPKQVVDVCAHAKATTGSVVSMRNFMLRGPAGTGKTEGAKAVAAGLGLPYVKYTCSANTEIYDFIGQVIPVMEDGQADSKPVSGGQIAASLSLPSLMEIRNDPDSAWEAITGKHREGVEPEECYREAVNRVSRKMAAAVGSQQYRYVETPFLRALEKGYVVEVQEPTVILQPGVLVGLNGLLDPDGDIFLPTGKTVRRHPDAVVIITTNTDYEGCRDVNQSVISRMHLVIDMVSPDVEIMTQRVLKLTGCSDKEMVRKMVEVVKSIEEYAAQHDITDGVCGIRELTSWVVSTDKVTHDPYESAQETIIPKISSERESQLEVSNACLAPIFSKKTRKRRTA